MSISGGKMKNYCVRTAMFAAFFAAVLVIALSLAGCDDGSNSSPDGCAHVVGAWTDTVPATATENGTQTGTCALCSQPTSRTAYATGTPGLEYELIDSNSAFRVRAGTVTTGTVNIPAFRLSDNGARYIPVTEIGSLDDNNGAFGYTDDISLTITNVVFLGPSNIKTIGCIAFSGCTSITSINIPSSLTSIGDGAFSDTGLTSITLPASMLIGANPFYGTSIVSFTLTGTGPLSTVESGRALVRNSTELVSYPSASGSIAIPAGITSIGDSAFLYTGLTSITLPAGLVSIGDSAFFYCTSLDKVTSLATTPPSLGSWAFATSFFGSNNLRIEVPAASVGAYKAASGWSELADRIFAIQ